jgi:chaperonin cofactor prefoldin
MTRATAIFAFLLQLICTVSVSAGNVVSVDAHELTQQAVAAYKRGDYQNAIKLLSERARMAPEDAEIYYYLGNCFVFTKQTDQAAHMYSACIRLAPGSQAGKYALSALESLSSASAKPAAEHAEVPPHGLVEAASDALVSKTPLDQAFNDAVKKIQSQRQTLKSRIDSTYQRMQDDLQSLNTRSTNYASELERIRREADNTVADLQARELRSESRLLAPDKIDARAIPQLPQEKQDDSKHALGSLIDYFKPEKPFDPFATELTPEISAKFMTVKDVFGELSTYQPSARRMAKQVFVQLKSSIEGRQDQLDRELYLVRNNLIHDIVTLQASDTSPNPLLKQLSPYSQAASSSIPRSDQNNLTPTEQEISRTVETTKKRIKELEDNYYKDVDSLIAGAKEKVGGMVAQTGQMNSQMKHPSGKIQLVPLGTDTYVRNYVNFGDRPELYSPLPQSGLKAEPASRMGTQRQQHSTVKDQKK